MIKEVWGNGIDVIIKYTKQDFNKIWVAASKWPQNCGDLSDDWLKKIGYRRIINAYCPICSEYKYL